LTFRAIPEKLLRTHPLWKKGLKMHRTIIVMATLLTCLFCFSIASADLDKGPYMQNVEQTKIQIVFEGDTGGKCEWGLTPAFGSQKNSIYNPINDMNRCELTGLTPNTMYYFKVTSEDDNAEGTFVTAPPAGEPFNFVVIGDTRSDNAGHQSVINGILNEVGNPDLFFNTGDLVADGMDEDQWDDYFEIEEDLLLNTVINPVVGNHEIETGLTMFTRWFTTGRYYTFTYGNAVFIVLDTEGVIAQGSAQYTMAKDALEDAVSDPAIDFKFVFFHQPGVTTGSHDPNRTIVNQYLDLFEQNNVDVVFNGHNHIYEHGLVNGVHHVVSGGGGVGTSSTFSTRDWTVHVESTRHFCTVSVEDDSYSVVVRRPDGSLVDQFSGDEATGGYPGPTPSDLVQPVCGGDSTVQDRNDLKEVKTINLAALLLPLGLGLALRRRR
jgi:Calcineurin-like phosphoesterase